MEVFAATGEQRFRVWIVQTENWQPCGWQDVPRHATAVEEAEPGCHTAEEAALFAEGFNNEQMLASGQHLWAVVVPVDLQYTGDLCPGQLVESDDLLHSPLPAD